MSSIDYVLNKQEEGLKFYKKFNNLDSYLNCNRASIKYIIDKFLDKIWKENFTKKNFEEIVEIILDNVSKNDFL